MKLPIRKIVPAGRDSAEPGWHLSREWLVTNGLGGYSCGTLAGAATRRYHGLLIAALHAPLGRTVMLNHLLEEIILPDGTVVGLSAEERVGQEFQWAGAAHLDEFRLEGGIPVWRFRVGSRLFEKTVFMSHLQNTVRVLYRMLEGEGALKLRVRPSLHFRGHEDPVDSPLIEPCDLACWEDRMELESPGLPPLRMVMSGRSTVCGAEGRRIHNFFYQVESHRGYQDTGDLWSPGYFMAELEKGGHAAFTASTETWEAIHAFTPLKALDAEEKRRSLLLDCAVPQARVGTAAELVLAADQFIVAPAGRKGEEAVAHAMGDEPRAIIAGYHWFTDWGRDSMIGLEGLTLATGRHMDARWILRSIARTVKNGLIPNLFPEGKNEGLYHTADATLWFFHALNRYVEWTGDRETLKLILPTLVSIAERHLRGTDFGIGADPQDGLLRQGAPGYQLTWMDAKVGDWVVTPRRGKAVEINALWYNALKLLEGWLTEEKSEGAAHIMKQAAERARSSFNEKFWIQGQGYLYDVVDGEGGHDAAFRPNQLFAISLDHPILDRARWEPVLQAVREKLLTPVGLRSLAPGHPDYKPQYYGDLRARDAAYHQGTVWAWLIGPFIDAWLKAYPDSKEVAREFLTGFEPHLNEACIGSISEIFDAEAPYTPRGCVAQAWSVAEVLRCWVKVAT